MFHTQKIIILSALFILSLGLRAQLTINPCIENTEFTIVVLGSSTAAGSGPSHPDSAWVNKYRNSLQNINPNNQVINLAVGGFTTYKIMPDSFAAPANRPLVDFQHNITKAFTYNPNAIIVNLPSNDRQWAKEEQLANFDSLYHHSINQGVPLFLCTTQPIVPLNYAQYQKEIADSILSLYSPYSIDFFYPIADTNFTVNPAYAADAVHLNDSGHRVLHNQVFQKDILSMIYNLSETTDLAVTGIYNLSGNCTNPSASVAIEITNLGDTVVGGSTLDITTNGINQTIVIQDSLFPCTSDSIIAFVDFSQDTLFEIDVEIISTADSNLANNQMSQIFDIKKTPQILVFNDTLCFDEATSFSSSLTAGDTIFWYASISDSIPIDSLSTFQISKDTTLYAQGVSGSIQFNGFLETSESSNINFNGNMFDLIALEDLTMNEIEIRSYDTGLVPVNIYVRSGSYIGNEQQPSAWTLWTQDTILVGNSGDWITIDANQLSLLGNDTTGVYIHMAKSSQRLQYLNTSQPVSFSTNELQFNSGKGISYQFGTAYSPRMINAKFHYQYGVNYSGECSTYKTPVYRILSKDSLDIGPDRNIPYTGDSLKASNGFTQYRWFHKESGDTISTKQRVFIDSNLFQNPPSTTAQISCYAVNQNGCKVSDSAVYYLKNNISISQNKKIIRTIRPNPAKDYVIIELMNPQAIEIELYNSTGQVVVKKRFVGSTFELPLQELENGFYTIKVQSNRNSDTFKLIIQH